jgi:DNA-binding transcriptional MerR regulator/effector-binding domain-containing protein
VTGRGGRRDTFPFRGRVYSIGEFSRITGLTIKTLRFYHEQRLLLPAHIDEETGYRYYAPSSIETARAISFLREVDFSIVEIREILSHADDEADVLRLIQRHKEVIEAKIRGYRKVVVSLNRFIAQEEEARLIMASASPGIEEKTVPAMLIAGVRMQGKYSDCGKGFAKVGRSFGRYIRGRPFVLHYCQEYRENDADFEACMPISSGKPVEGISVRELPGGRCVSLVHRGPYNELGRSYAKISDYIHQKGYHVTIPSREIYIKGPGMIFKGNPKNYLTEIQMFIANDKPSQAQGA